MPVSPLPRDWNIVRTMTDMMRRIRVLELRKLDRAADGTLQIPRIRLTTTQDASLTSTMHPFQIGPTDGSNLIMDANEIMSRNNGVGAFVAINAEGGSVSIASGTGAGDVDIGTGANSSSRTTIGNGDNNGSRLNTPPVWTDSTSSANNHVFINGSGGWLRRDTSVRAAKAAIEDAPDEWAEKFLALRPRTWYDRGNAERYAGLLTREESGETIDWATEVKSLDSPTEKVPGFVAEELVEAGLAEFAIYDTDSGELSGIAYDRLIAAAHSTITRQQAQIDAQQDQIDGLQAQIDDLRSAINP